MVCDPWSKTTIGMQKKCGWICLQEMHTFAKTQGCVFHLDIIFLLTFLLAWCVQKWYCVQIDNFNGTYINSNCVLYVKIVCIVHVVPNK